MKKQPLVLIGARQTWDWITETCEALEIPVLGFVDQLYAGRVDSVGGLPCLGSELDLIENPKKFGDAKFFIGTFWDGNSNVESTVANGHQLRLQHMKFIKDNKLECHTLIDPQSMLSKNVKVGQGTFISRNVNIRGGVEIGEHCNFLDNSGIATDTKVGDNCILSAGAYLMSNVILGNNVYVGTRATVLNGHSSKQENVTIGDDCKIHAHVLVNKDLKPNTTAILRNRVAFRNNL